jgi:hypothetical protein
MKATRRRCGRGWFARQTAFTITVIAITALLVLVGTLGASSKPRLFVFANADIRPRALEQELEATLPGVDVTVFGRIRGLMRAVEEENPDAVLARRPVLESMGLGVGLQGYAKGSPTEQYVLMATGRELSPGQLQGKTVGAVDIFARQDMPGFVAKVLGVPSPKLKHVTHENDLLPLLQFDAVAAVILAARWERLLRSKSELDIRSLPLKEQVGLAAVAFRTSNGRSEIERSLKAAGQQLNSRLGVDQWK